MSGIAANKCHRSSVLTAGLNARFTTSTSWGRALAFYRFPWNNADLQTANPAAPGSRNFKFSDPIDTGGTLMNNTWYSSGARTTFEQQFHEIKNQMAGPRIGNANYVIPVIVSGGPNGKMDIGPDLLPGPGAVTSVP